ncbi:MAG: hypothetical protein ACT4ON_01670 [Bacteroidota bacterium]
MIQEIIACVLSILATVYMGYRIYCNIKKKRSCDSCALMDAAKKMDKNQ